MLWVGFEGAAGLRLVGPLARAWAPPGADWANDVVGDLQRIDVLRGGSPELIVKLRERHTLADVALNEVLELDRTRVLIFTLDRGGLVSSPELGLELARARHTLDAEAKAMPRAYEPLPRPGQSAGYRMRVSWGGPDSITLTRIGGDAPARREGVITLFGPGAE